MFDLNSCCLTSSLIILNYFCAIKHCLGPLESEVFHYHCRIWIHHPNSFQMQNWNIYWLLLLTLCCKAHFPSCLVLDTLELIPTEMFRHNSVCCQQQSKRDFFVYHVLISLGRSDCENLRIYGHFFIILVLIPNLNFGGRWIDGKWKRNSRSFCARN